MYKTYKFIYASSSNYSERNVLIAINETQYSDDYWKLYKQYRMKLFFLTISPILRRFIFFSLLVDMELIHSGGSKWWSL